MKNRASLGGCRTSFSQGFTLVEILAAFAVLAMIILILAQITSATTHTTLLSNQKIDGSSQARVAFDRIGLDLANLVKRADVDFYVRDPRNSAANTGYSSDDDNTLLLFLATVNSSDTALTSPAQNRSTSLIAYQVNAHPNNTGSGGQVLSCLIRAGKAVPWTRPTSWASTGFMGLTANDLPVRFNTADTNFVGTLLPKAPSSSDVNDYDILAPGVIRMVVGFQLYPDNTSVTMADGTSATAQGQIVYSAPVRTVTSSDGATTAKYIDLNRISAIVIGLVIIDRNSLKRLTSDHVTSISGKFSVPPNHQLPLQAWSSIANNLAIDLSGSVPLTALQGVHVYQRFYPVTPFPSKQP